MLEKLRALVGLLPHIRVLTLKPGDVLVLRVDRELSGAERDECAEALRSEFPGHRGIVLDDGAWLEVVREGAPL